MPLVFVITLILICCCCCCCCCCCYCYKKKKTASKPAPNQAVVRPQTNAYPMRTVQPQSAYTVQTGYPPANPPANAPYPTNQAASTQNVYMGLNQQRPTRLDNNYADPAYPPAPYHTSQQPPAKDPTGQQSPAKDPTGQQPSAPTHLVE